MSIVESPSPARRRSATDVRTHRMLCAVVGVLTLAVLMYSVVEQLFDTNFYFVWQATALLAGDHPYRDFYEMGSPLMTLECLVGGLRVFNRRSGWPATTTRA